MTSAKFSGVNVAHVVKAQPQYCSNVAMKVNAKLGGTTCKVANAKNWFTVPTMIIGKFAWSGQIDAADFLLRF